MSDYSQHGNLIVIIIGTFLTRHQLFIWHEFLFDLVAVYFASIMGPPLLLLISLDRPFQGDFGIQPLFERC